MFGYTKFLPKPQVLLFIHWTVKISGFALVVARSKKSDVPIQRFSDDDGASSIEKAEVFHSRKATQIFR